MTHTEHSIHVQAPAGDIYEVLADVETWPLIFPPTVHAVTREDADGHQLIELWAMAGGVLKNWQSTRVLNREQRTIEFRQVRRDPSVQSMVGLWRIEESGEGSLVTLTHDFEAAPGGALGLTDIERAVDGNSNAELGRLKTACEKGLHRPGAARITFEDDIVVRGSAADAFAFIDRAEKWPDRLAHVAAMDLVEEEPGLQVMRMVTRAPDGSEHTTASGRVCARPDVIRYKQFECPPALHAHRGRWEFHDLGDGAVRVVSHHEVVIDFAATAALPSPPASDAEAAQLVRHSLGSNSRATLSYLREHLEGHGSDFVATPPSELAPHERNDAVSDAFTLQDLKKYLFLALGEDETLDLTSAGADDPLRDRGVDSLAVIDARRRIERERAITLSEPTGPVETFGDFLALVPQAQLQGA